MINKLYSALALFLFSGLVNAFTVYTDKIDWENALSGAVVITEDFEDQTMVDGLASYRVYDMNPGGMGMETFIEFQDFSLIASTPSKPTFSGTQVFEELADGAGSAVWNFSSPYIAFGGNWDLAGPANPGAGLAIKINGEILDEFISNTYAGGFWGVIANEEGDLPFSTVEVLIPGTTGSELYHLDDMVFATVVPLPAAIWLLASGFIGLLGYKKRFSH